MDNSRNGIAMGIMLPAGHIIVRRENHAWGVSAQSLPEAEPEIRRAIREENVNPVIAILQPIIAPISHSAERAMTPANAGRSIPSLVITTGVP